MSQSLVEALYGQQVKEILSSGAPTIVLGGRGMGKTSALRWLATQSDASFIDGRTFDTAVELVDRAYAGLQSKPRDVVIDDLDHLLNDDRSSHDTVQALVDRIDALRAELAQQQKRLVVASTHPVSRFLRSPFSQFWSGIETRFQQHVLFPWSIDWRRVLHSATLLRFPQYGAACAGSVVAASGGHPSMVASAFTALASYGDPSPAPEDVDWTAVLVQTLGRIGLPPVEKALHDLQASAHQTDQLALEHLAALVQDGGIGESPKAPQVLRCLELSGLAYGDPADGTCTVPGLVILRFLEGELAPLGRPATREVRVVSRGVDEGSLFVGPSDREIPLSKGLWHLVLRLSQARGEAVPLDELANTLGFDSQKPLYSIIQRLDQKAKEVQLDRIVENVRGKGYRLSHAILWKG